MRPALEERAEELPRSRSGALRLQTFSSLRHRDYRYLWTSSLFSSGAQWIQQVTLGWLVYQMTGSALLLGAVNGMRALPFLVTGPLAGVVADRMDRRKVLIATQLFLAVTALAFAVDVATDYVKVWHIFVFTLFAGIGWSFNQPVRQTLVPNLVPRADLLNAIALNSAAFNITRVLGPAVAGILIAAMGPAGNFFMQSSFYVVVALMVLQINIPARAAPSSQASVRESLVEGLRYVAHDRTVLTLILVALIPMLLLMPFTALMPIFAKDVLGRGPEGLGFLLSAVGLGALAGTLTLASLGNFQHKGWLLVFGAALMSASLVLFALLARPDAYLLSLGLLVVVGVFQMLFMATNNTLLQTVIPDAVRGRVMSIYHMDMGLVPLGALVAGLLAQHLGAPRAVALMGLASLALAIGVAIGVPHVRRLR